VRWLVQAGTYGDWFSNPWHVAGLDVAQYSGAYELRKLQIAWTRTPTVGVVQDRDLCTFHFLKLSGGSPSATWVDGDFTTVENGFDTLWNALGPYYPPETKLAEYLWRADGPAFKPFGAALSPTVRVVPRAIAGAGAVGNVLPPQVATSVTEVTEASFLVHGVGVPGDAVGTGRTQRRNRWGRFYLPATSTGWLSDGRIQPTHCSELSALVKTWYNACVAAHIIPVMYSPTTGNAWSVIAVHVDDIVDVVRSRRYVTPTTRASNDITAPS
jgi:hypothetical protein